MFCCTIHFFLLHDYILYCVHVKKKINTILCFLVTAMLRTPDECFAAVEKSFSYTPHYLTDLEGFEGIRIHYVDEVNYNPESIAKERNGIVEITRHSIYAMYPHLVTTSSFTHQSILVPSWRTHLVLFIPQDDPYFAQARRTLRSCCLSRFHWIWT